MGAMVLVPRCQVSVRTAIAGDYAFIDSLQDMHSKALGFMRKSALEEKIARGEILIAEDETRLPIGYCIFSDRYFKRDEVGVVYQMNVLPGLQRKLVAATLLKAVFEHVPYGCKLFSCWCAQDLDANYFWEAMGFLPIAFRTGAVGKKGPRIHIFWQRRIRQGDTTTPYWYPSKTDGGMMRQDRIVLPIPPGVHWKSEMPVFIPQVQNALPEPKKERIAKPKETPKLMPPTRRGARFGPPSLPMVTAPPPDVVEQAKPAKAKRPAREKIKADPQHVAAARELRDRYLEQYNAEMVLPAPVGKYEVARPALEGKAQKQLDGLNPLHPLNPRKQLAA